MCYTIKCISFQRLNQCTRLTKNNFLPFLLRIVSRKGTLHSWSSAPRGCWSPDQQHYLRKSARSAGDFFLLLCSVSRRGHYIVGLLPLAVVALPTNNTICEISGRFFPADYADKRRKKSQAEMSSIISIPFSFFAADGLLTSNTTLSAKICEISGRFFPADYEISAEKTET
ncbi:MAG: hypothetical protein RLZZ28_1863, partial [Bacteroidota bacterium]